MPTPQLPLSFSVPERPTTLTANVGGRASLFLAMILYPTAHRRLTRRREKKKKAQEILPGAFIFGSAPATGPSFPSNLADDFPSYHLPARQSAQRYGEVNAQGALRANNLCRLPPRPKSATFRSQLSASGRRKTRAGHWPKPKAALTVAYDNYLAAMNLGENRRGHMWSQFELWGSTTVGTVAIIR